ncbi:MAG: hypothetical protein K2M91_09830 [Lachnospiraceae bacterium]|nr:hypothetical protein [Lachnospiraceae bacterium]
MKILKMAVKRIWKHFDRRSYKRHSGSRIVKAEGIYWRQERCGNSLSGRE